MKCSVILASGVVLLSGCQQESAGPKTTTLSLKAIPDVGGNGQILQFQMRLDGSQEHWKVALFSEDPSGLIMQLLPNRLDSGFTLTGGQNVLFPSSSSGYTFTMDGVVVITTVLLLASPRAVNLGELSQYNTAQDQFAVVNSSGRGTLLSDV